MRDAPAVDIIGGLQKGGASVRAFDPVAMPAAAKVLRDVKFCSDAYEACEGADAVLIVTEWNQFRMLELERIRALLARPIMIDLRNVYEPGPMAKAGFEYHSVGR
jgi:UDPglucose 6-dehydrogenase